MRWPAGLGGGALRSDAPAIALAASSPRFIFEDGARIEGQRIHAAGVYTFVAFLRIDDPPYATTAVGLDIYFVLFHANWKKMVDFERCVWYTFVIWLSSVSQDFQIRSVFS